MRARWKYAIIYALSPSAVLAFLWVLVRLNEANEAAEALLLVSAIMAAIGFVVGLEGE